LALLPDVAVEPGSLSRQNANPKVPRACCWQFPLRGSGNVAADAPPCPNLNVNVRSCQTPTINGYPELAGTRHFAGVNIGGCYTSKNDPREAFSVGKTALLAGDVTGVMLLIFIATAPAAILAASGP